MPSNISTIHSRDWLLLVLLSVLWGGSFFFVGVALKELPPFTIVFLRAAIAALILVALARQSGTPLPRRPASWPPFAIMAALNYVIPFSCLAVGQTFIPTGLASVLNATTPMFTVLVMAAAREEKLQMQRIAGVVVGIVGVAILRGVDLRDTGKGIGVALCLCAALSYGLSALWARRALVGFAPLTMAAGQMTAATVFSAIVAAFVDQPWRLPIPSFAVMSAIACLGAVSTALGYILFFRIIVRSGSTNVMLVTLLIPVTAILLGVLVLGETIGMQEIVGALIIASALLIIDGRVLNWLRGRWRGVRV